MTGRPAWQVFLCLGFLSRNSDIITQDWMFVKKNF